MVRLRKTGRRGFTLVELIIVVAVLAILAGIAIPAIATSVRSANADADATAARTIENALKVSASEYKNKRATKAMQDNATPKVGDALLNANQSVSILTPVQPGCKFYYNTVGQTVGAYTSSPGSDYVELEVDTDLKAKLLLIS